MSNKGFKYTNSTTSKVFNEITGNFLDTDLDFLDRGLEKVRKQIEGISIFTELHQIGITRGTETIEKIVNNLPSNSILIYHKYGDAIPIYPQRTGLLVVIKGLDNSRVKFSYSANDYFYVGFYDNLRMSNDFWSGWKKIITSSNGIFDIDKVVCRAFGNGGTTIMHNSLDGNGKNLGWSRSKFKQVVSENGYFDRIEVNDPIVVGGAGLYKNVTEPIVGMSYFDTEISKPLWYNGSNWVDCNGNIIK